MATPRDLVEEISSEYVNSGPLALRNLAGAIVIIQKAFPKYQSYLMEFVQNADDARSGSLRIEVLQNAMRILNDGLPFSEEDVRSVCGVALSSKTAKEYIGYLGVGFKSVFLICECPEIYSGDYQFKFDKSAWQDPKRMPWQIIPFWIDNPAVDLSKYPRFKTVFNLPLLPDSMEKLRWEITSEHLNNRILLFLRHIREIEIVDVAQDLRRRIVRSTVSKTSKYEIHQIEEYQNDDTLRSQDLWLVFRSACSVPADVRGDYTTREWERQDVDKREIVTAFRLDDENNLAREKEGTAHIGVFSFLPLREIPSGLNFLLQADFLTAPGRSELARECLWNNWLADEIYDLITKKCVRTFLRRKKWKMNFTDILYSSAGGHELFAEHIKSPLNEYLENKAVLIAEDGTALSAEELIMVDEEIRELFTDDDLELLHPKKRVLHEHCSPHPQLKTRVKEIPGPIDEFVRSSDGESLIQSRAKRKRKNVEWFKKLYSTLVEKYDYGYFCDTFTQYKNVKFDRFWEAMRGLNAPIILTNAFNVARINEAYVKPGKLRVPQELRGKFKIVHREIARAEQFDQLTKKLNEERYYYPLPDTRVPRELTEEHIRNASRQQEAQNLPLIKDNWDTLPDEERISTVREIKKQWDESVISLEDYDFVTLKTKDAEWIKPKLLVLPEEYDPEEHDLETLVKKELYDSPLRFLSAEFIGDSANSDEIGQWRRFFEELGVDRIVKSRREGGKREGIVERIAILTARRYEEQDKRVAEELGQSQNPGYDIESRAASEERYIEVKGISSDSSEGFEISLSPNEYETLQANKHKYFIYTVLDALRDPLLWVVRGDQVDESGRLKISIPSKDLEKLKDDEFRP
jgi:hypothetical protein